MESLTTSRTDPSYIIKRPICRVALACIQCRSRKVKCDSTQPICTRCRVDEKQCEYRKSRRGGRPRRPLAAPLQAAEDDLPIVLQTPDQQAHDSSRGTNSSNSSGLDSSESSARSVSDTFEASLSLNTLGVKGTQLTTIQVDQLLSQYYIYFHVAHPCVLPQWSLRVRLPNDITIAQTLLPVLLYIGSIFTPSIPSTPLADAAFDAINLARSNGTILCPYYVQALVLFCIAVYWSNEPEKGRELLDEAIQVALGLGMHETGFAMQYSEGDPVLEESWRRTWWQLYITDAHIAGSTHSFPTKTGNIQTSVGLPCEEESYESGVSHVFLGNVKLC